MLKTIKLLSPLLLIFLMIGCGGDSELGILNPTTSDPVGISTSAKAIPEGATITSAVLFMNVDYPTDQRIDAHRITAAWDENTVTWNSFGTSYMPGIEGSFYADGMGWHSVDLTALVQGWVDGDFPNYGVLLHQDSLPYSRTIMWSREGLYPPYLRVCYEYGGIDECEDIAPLGDGFIYEIYPDSNFNSSIPELLLTGASTDVDPEKMSMLQFELPTTPPEDGCTSTIGYWKNHAGLGNGNQEDMVTPLLPIWLGDEVGDSSLYVNTAAMAVDVLEMKTYGHQSNGITKLYAQLLGAKLNLASGASDNAIADVIDEADEFLASHRFGNWNDLSDDMQDTVLDWKDMLDDYNNGVIGPGHCGDDGDDPDKGPGGPKR